MEGLLASRAWTEIIQPAYQAKLQTEVEALVASKLNEDQTTGAIETLMWALKLPSFALRERERERRRGRIRVLEALLSWPKSEVDQNTLDLQREQEYSKRLASDAMEAHYANFGYKSPYAPPDNQG